ncbi:MAG TPA: YwmB family TATA-box binding protein, partial [Bacillota bacterium]|nr:YwmB family TATA-box binding protein [Bacillota bacterium]
KTFLNRHFFTQSARLFACIKLNDDAIIDKNDHFEKLSQIFHIEDTIIQKDSTNEQNNYQILYGHTHLFTESLQVNDHSMNVHLVKRNQEQQTAFFIGTPILLNEY